MNTLAEQIAEYRKQQNERIAFYKTTPFTEEEKTYWGNYILNDIQNNPNSLGREVHLRCEILARDNILYEGDNIWDVRIDAFAKWLESEGLYLLLQYNQRLTVYTQEAIDMWKHSLGCGCIMTKDGIVKYVERPDNDEWAKTARKL